MSCLSDVKCSLKKGLFVWGDYPTFFSLFETFLLQVLDKPDDTNTSSALDPVIDPCIFNSSDASPWACMFIRVLILSWLCLLPLQHVVFLVKFSLAWMIPDVPADVTERIKRERYLVQEYLHEYQVKRLTSQLSGNQDDSTSVKRGQPSSPAHEVVSENL